MAKVTAVCKCDICGCEFEKTSTKANRREADAWAAWAKQNFTVCPSCYGKQKRQEEKEAGLIAKIRLGDPYGTEDTFWIVLFGETYEIKDKLKEIGARWTNAYPDSDNAIGVLMSGLSMKRPMNRWAIPLSDLEALPEKVRLLENMGFAIESPGDDVFIAYKTIRAEVKKRKEAEQAEQNAIKEKKRMEQQKALEALGPKPVYSDEIHTFFPTGSTWNRKFYGKPGKYRVYISGQEVSITDEQKAEMEQTLKDREAWDEKRKAILEQ